MVRGAATLPHGTGKSVRVCVFAKDEAADAARAAGAEVVGDDDLIAQILESGGGGLQFDKCIATPDMMPRLSRVSAVMCGSTGVQTVPGASGARQELPWQ
jgi:ribosomal protein L1